MSKSPYYSTERNSYTTHGIEGTFYKNASELEDRVPSKALEIYKNLEEANTAFHLDIVVLACIGSALGFIVAYFGNFPLTNLLLFFYGRYFEELSKQQGTPFDPQDVEEFAILIIWSIITSLALAIGLVPKMKEKWRVVDLLPFMPFVFISVIVSYFVILVIGLMPGLTGRLINFIETLSPQKLGAVLGLFLGLGALELFINPVEKLRLRKSEIRFSFMLAILIFLMFTYSIIIEGIIIGACIGAVFGWKVARIDQDPELVNLFKIGQARCLIRLGRDFEAAFLLAKNLNPLGKTGAINELVDAVNSLTIFIDYESKDPSSLRPKQEPKTYLEQCKWILEEAFTKSIRHKYKDLIKDSIQRTKELAKALDVHERVFKNDMEYEVEDIEDEDLLINEGWEL